MVYDVSIKGNEKKDKDKEKGVLVDPISGQGIYCRGSFFLAHGARC
jgi:hypothetical protein